MYDGNYVKILSFLNETCEYIEDLKDHKGERIISSDRKVGFLGLIICIKSTIDLYGRLVIRHGLVYLPLYKFTQDHLEMFFSSIRSHGGWNNNPNTRQFTSDYKKLLIHCELFEDSRGNYVKLENISILMLLASNSPLKMQSICHVQEQGLVKTFRQMSAAKIYLMN